MPLHQPGASRARFPRFITPLLIASGMTIGTQAAAELQTGSISSAPDTTPITQATNPAATQRLPSISATEPTQIPATDMRLAELESQLQARDAEIARLTSALNERRLSTQTRIDEHLQQLRAQIPVTEGGNLTPEAARARAEADMQAFESLLSRARGIDNPELWRQIRDAENALHHSQFLLARAEQARTVYRLRPTDSLAGISMLFYGDPERWPQVLDANRHILADPQQLPPGVTLVIP